MYIGEYLVHFSHFAHLNVTNTKAKPILLQTFCSLTNQAHQVHVPLMHYSFQIEFIQFHIVDLFAISNDLKFPNISSLHAV